MSQSRRAQIELAIANRILARHGVLGEDGHVGLRHPRDPGRFFLARALHPALVEPDDIVELSQDGRPIVEDARPLGADRFIHAAVLAARPDIHAVLYGTSHDLMVFGITRVPLRPVVASVGDMGARVPVWDIAEKFGSDTDLRVSDLARARDLARCLGPHRVCLLRGAGFVATGRSLNDLVRMSVYLARNARALAASLRLGAVRGISPGETAARLAIDPESNAMRRGWEYWAKEAGCERWLTE